MKPALYRQPAGEPTVPHFNCSESRFDRRCSAARRRDSGSLFVASRSTAGIAAIAIVVISIAPVPASAQADGKTVTIAGPLPLPITGSVGITGTPAFNINSALQPLTVRNVDEAGRNPFQTGFFNIVFHAGNNTAPITVPAGKTLVIQYIASTALLSPAPRATRS